MSLVSLFVVIVVLVLVFYLLQRYVAPALPPPLGTVLIVFYVVLVCLWMLSLIGVLPAGDINSIRIGK